MSSWMNDASIQSHNGPGFNHLDPNAGGGMLDASAFMGNSNSFDPSQFQNQQLQQRMQNGAMRNGSPAFNNPVYQTNSVIPSKRPRPREDSLGTSPRQAAGMLPNSRSQTPQQPPYTGFQPNSIPPQHAPQQNPYSHLQNGSANASPSPIMSNQLRPGGVPQRVSTASPHPFSPVAQQFAPQASPSQSDHGSRVDTPQNNPYAQNPGFAQGFHQNFTPPPGRGSAPPPNAMSTPQLQQAHIQQSQMYAQQSQQQPQPGQQRQNDQHAKMMYQIRYQQQLQQQGLMAAQRPNMPPNVNPLAKAQIQGPNGQPVGMRPQQPAQSGQPNQEQFMKSLTLFMQSKNLSFDMNPIVGDRSITLITLYMAVLKFGGYKKVTHQNGWAQVAQALQFNLMQHPSAPQQLKAHYERNLLLFEEAWQRNQMAQRQKMMQQQGLAGNMGGPGSQMSPTKQMNPQGPMQQSQQYLQHQQLMAQHQMQQQHAQSTPIKQMAPMHLSQPPAMNGFSTPQPSQAQPQHPMGPQGHVRNNLSRNIDGTPPQNGAFPIPSPVSATKSASLSLPSPQVDVARPGAKPADPEFKLPKELDPKTRVLDTFGGVELDSLQRLGNALIQFRPDVPAVADMGAIDIHALTMSLQSGIHAEVRMALDTLVSLSVEARLQLDLRACEDLVETLVDCAEIQVELLAENAAEVSDVMLVNSYEDVIRGCRLEEYTLQDVPAFGTLEYDLDRAVDRLICISTIMRNLSFYESNHQYLADELVIKFFCVVIRYLGTRNMLLRTHQNTLDFMKDVIIFLSNLAQQIELPGREQALCLLHFLLAFAPCPPPNGSDRVTFSPYDPVIHRYLPPAIDSLAKLLARDEPNRTHYKSIFASDVASSPPFDLLTKTFALAISAIPDERLDTKRGSLMSIIEARKPFLMQGMLAAEILSNLAPGFETGVAKSWLMSEDGFAQNLSRLILFICLETAPAAPHQRVPAVAKGVEDEALLHITLGGITVLRRLAEKCRDPDDPKSAIPLSGIVPKERLLRALEIRQPKLQIVLKQLCAYAGLDT